MAIFCQKTVNTVMTLYGYGLSMNDHFSAKSSAVPPVTVIAFAAPLCYFLKVIFVAQRHQ